MDKLQIAVFVEKLEVIKSLLEQSLLEISYDYVNDKAIFFDLTSKKIQAVLEFEMNSRLIIEKLLLQE